MPTKKRRVGFIPRSEVLNFINKLSFEKNLSISKIINILVEEALFKRGIFNIKTGKVLNVYENIDLNNTRLAKKNDNHDFSNKFYNNFKKNNNQHFTEETDEFIDNEMYTKFLMFLQFQERMKKGEL